MEPAGGQQEVERRLAESEARQGFLLRLADIVGPIMEPDRILFEAAKALGEHLRADRVGYAEIEADGIHSRVTRNYTNGVRSIEGRYRVADYSPALLAALHAGQTVATNDVSAIAGVTDSERAAHAALQVSATVDLPLIKRGQLVAVLFMHHREPHVWSECELTLLRDVAARTWDAVERARAEDALKASEERLRLALEVAELGTWTWDLGTGSGDLDARGAEIVGLPPGALADVAAAQFSAIHPDDLEATQTAAAAGIASREPFTLEYRVIYPDGGVHHVFSRAYVVTDAQGHAVRLVGTNRDVTDQVRARREIEGLLEESERARAEADALRRDAEAAQAAAETANRSKSEFLAVMSHELRTPLNAIAGYADLLDLGVYGSLNDAQRAGVTRIRQSQHHLLGLINQVLNYARIDAGAVRYVLSSIDVSEAVNAAEALVHPHMRERGLTAIMDEGLPGLAVRADPDKLQQILLNLLTNAIKFTPAGGEIRLSLAASDSVASITVSDTGVGIAPDKLAGIFEPFIQVDQRLTRTHDGVGLGLAISRDLARGMNGDLSAQSTLGQGSRLTLTLPRA